MIDREVQVITSDYGSRKILGVPGKFHAGIDLRNWDDSFTHRLAVVLPEGSILKRKVFEEMWGWTFVFTPLTSGRFEIMFTHMAGNDKLQVGEVYDKGYKIGYNMLTRYMVEKKLGEHLHFSVWSQAGVSEDPKKYYDEMKIKYKMKGA